MIVVTAVLQAKEGKEKEMEEVLKGIFPHVQSEEGTLKYILHRSQSNPGRFLFYEKYKDQDAFAAHGATPYLAELFAKVGPLMEGEPSLEMYEEIAAKE